MINPLARPGYALAVFSAATNAIALVVAAIVGQMLLIPLFAVFLVAFWGQALLWLNTNHALIEIDARTNGSVTRLVKANKR